MCAQFTIDFFLHQLEGGGLGPLSPPSGYAYASSLATTTVSCRHNNENNDENDEYNKDNGPDWTAATRSSKMNVGWQDLTARQADYSSWLEQLDRT